MLLLKDLSIIVQLKTKYAKHLLQYMNRLDRRTKHKKWISIQIGIWAIYWIIELIKLSFIFTSIFIEVLVNLSCSTLLFYALILFVAPAYKSSKQIPYVLLRFVLTILLFVILRRASFLLMAEVFGFSGVILTNLNYFWVSSFDIIVEFGTYAALVWFFLNRATLQKQIYEKQLEEERLQNELLVMEQAVLKAQINPHFLFNILSYINSKALKAKDEGQSEAIILLSDILRHSLKDHAKDHLVPINNELEHIQNLNKINTLLFDGQYYLQIKESGSGYNHKIPPFVILTFFENAMKHGIIDDPDNPVQLSVLQSEEGIEIYIRNKIKEISQVDPKAKFAIGKKYIQTILDHFYQKNYTLAYQEDEKYYIVDLKIKVK